MRTEAQHRVLTDGRTDGRTDVQTKRSVRLRRKKEGRKLVIVCLLHPIIRKENCVFPVRKHVCFCAAVPFVSDRGKEGTVTVGQLSKIPVKTRIKMCATQKTSRLTAVIYLLLIS